MKMMFQFRKQKRWKQKQLLFPACPGQEASSRVELQAGIMVSSHQAQGHKLRAPQETQRSVLAGKRREADLALGFHLPPLPRLSLVTLTSPSPALTVPAAPWMVPTHLKRLSDSGKAEIPLSPDIWGGNTTHARLEEFALGGPVSEPVPLNLTF